jgi:methylglutaconyl-CoA hydratase
MSGLAQLTTSPGTAIATLTINRPDARNALSIDLLREMHRRLDELGGILARNDASAPRVLILTGAGKSFCAGMDLKQVLSDPAKPLELLSSLADFCLKLRALPCVTVASVNGAAIGGGCGLVTVCDFAVTHADSKMGFPEVDLGVCPAVVAPWLVRKIGAGRARMVLLRGGVMTGQQAADLGIVTQCVPTLDGLAPAVQSLAERLASGGPQALRATKALLNDLDGSLDAAVARRAAELSANVLKTPETIATLRAKLGS